MLTHAPVTTILVVKDSDRARRFYEQILGLNYVGQSGDGKHLFSFGSGTLALLQKEDGTKAEHTALSFEVPDTDVAVRELRNLCTSRGLAS